MSANGNVLAQTTFKGFDEDKNAAAWAGGGIAKTGSASGFNPCDTPDFSEVQMTGIEVNDQGLLQDIAIFSC